MPNLNVDANSKTSNNIKISIKLYFAHILKKLKFEMKCLNIAYSKSKYFRATFLKLFISTFS